MAEDGNVLRHFSIRLTAVHSFRSDHFRDSSNANIAPNSH